MTRPNAVHFGLFYRFMCSSFSNILIQIITTAVIFILWGNSAEVQKRYPEHLTGAFTGGFAEKTCHSCHFDYDLNWKEGRLRVNGIPDNLKAGSEYEIEIIVEREDLGRAGFQMTSRFKDASQAGNFNPDENNRIMPTKTKSDSIQYIQHSSAGTGLNGEGQNSWIVKWQAPKQISDSIVFNIAANAANGDDSEFGDWIYVKEIRVR